MKYIYPEYVSEILYGSKKKLIPDIKLCSNFKTNIIIDKVKKTQNSLEDKNFFSYEELEKKLTPVQLEKLNKIKFPLFTKNNSYIPAKYNIGDGWSNAFRKMYETCVKTELITSLKTSNIKYIDLCGFPGSFVIAINYYLKTKHKNVKYDWYIQSYISKHDPTYFGDRYGLKRKYPDRFIYLKKGDITDSEEVMYYIDFFKNKKRNLVTSDCGSGKEWSSIYNREKTITKTFFGSYITATGILSKGGNLFTKYFHIYENFNMSLIYLMILNFEKVYLVKPESSRQFGGSEIYFVCIGYKDNISVKKLKKLLNILDNFLEKDLKKSLFNYADIDENILNNMEEKLAKFFTDKLNKIKEKYILIDELVDLDINKNFDKYYNKKLHIYKNAMKIENKYFNNYFIRLKYTKIKNKNNLL